MTIYVALTLLIHFCAFLYVTAVCAGTLTVTIKKPKDNDRRVPTVNVLFSWLNLVIFYTALFTLSFSNMIYALLYAQAQSFTLASYKVMSTNNLMIKDREYTKFLYRNIIITFLFALTFLGT